MRPHAWHARLILLVAVLFGLIAGGVVSAQQVRFAQPILVVNTSFLNVRYGPGVQYAVLVTVVGGTELPVLGVANDKVWYQVATDGGPGWVNVEFTLPRGDFTNVPLVRFDATQLVNPGQGGGAPAPGPVSSGRTVTGVVIIGGDLRVSPSYDAMIIRSALPNDPNTILPLLNEITDGNGVKWSLVNVPGVGTGWIDRTAYRQLECGTDTIGVIVANNTPIRFDGIANRDPFLLNFGTEGYIVGRDGDFTLFELTDGTVGRVIATDIGRRPADVRSICEGIPAGTAASAGQGGGAPAPGTVAQPPRLSSSRVIVNTGFLNIRSGPTAGFSVVATVPGGTELAVVGRAADGVWFLVEGDFGQGWLNNQFTIFRGVYSTVPVVRDLPDLTSSLGQGGGAPTPGPVSSGRTVTGVVIIGGDLRVSPSYDAMIIRSALPNDPNTILPLLNEITDGNGVKWSLVNVPGVGTGWIDRTAYRQLECGTDTIGVIVANNTPIRFDGIANRDPFLLNFGTEGYIVGRDGDFTLFELTDGTVGRVIATDIGRRPADVRSICEGIPAGTAASAGQGGGAPAPGTVAQPPRLSSSRVIVNTGFLNIRSGPTAGFSVVATVPGGTELAVVGRAADGVWFLVEGSFGQGWLNNQFVLFRGNYASVPVIRFNN